MYQIALCDDESEELEKTEHIIKLYGQRHNIEFIITRFCCADQLIQAMQETGYFPDILFMDIYMPGTIGIKAAGILREMRQDCRIVFLTTSTEYALEAFRVKATQYLVKPVSAQDIFSLLDDLFEGTEKAAKQKSLLLHSDNREYRVPLSDIVFCEAHKKRQCIHRPDQTKLFVSMTMAKLYELLTDAPEFTKVGASYIVNLEHVDHLSSRELSLDNGESIYLPRGSYPALRERYFAYYCGDDEEA